jgi:predicted nuclease of predicted toxin-antitoxin system
VPAVRFLVDMWVDVRVADWLRVQGHDVVHLREQGLQRLSDGAIMEKAVAEDRVVMTFDLDFSEIAALPTLQGPSPHPCAGSASCAPACA